MMRTLDTAARVVAQKNKISREAAIRIILQNVEIAKPFGDTTDTGIDKAGWWTGNEQFQDFVPKSVKEILDELYKGMPAKDVVSGASPSAEKPNSAGLPGSRDNPIILKSPEDIDKLGPGVYFKDPRGDVYGPTPG